MSRETHQTTVTLENEVAVSVPIQATERGVERFPETLHKTWQKAISLGQETKQPDIRAKAIGTQIRCALIKTTISDLAGQFPPELLAVLLQQQVWSPEQALAWIEQMEDRRRRCDSLFATAPFIPHELSPWLLRVLRSTHSYRAATPYYGHFDQELAPDYKVSEVLGVILPNASQRDSFYLTTSARLVPYLPEPAQSTVIDEVLQIAHSPHVCSFRDELLAAILPYLTASQVRSSIQIAVELPIPHPPRVDNPRTECLVVLLPRLAEFGEVEEALSLVRKMASDQDRAVHCLIDIAPTLPEGQRGKLLSQIRESALNLKSVRSRHLALMKIGAQFAEEQNHSEVENTILLCDDEGLKLWVMAQLVEDMPQDWRRDYFDMASRRIKSIPLTSDARSDIFQRMALQFVRNGEIEAAVDHAGKACAKVYNWWELTDVLVPLAAAFGKMGYGEALLNHVRQLDQDTMRLAATAVLARWLPEPLNRLALERALDEQVDIFDSNLQIRVLAKLATRLNKSEQEDMVTTVLTLGQAAMWDWDSRDDWLAALESLVGLSSQLRGTLRQEIVEVALRDARRYCDEHSQAGFLIRLLPSLQDPLRSKVLDIVCALVDNFRSSSNRVNDHFKLAPYLQLSEETKQQYLTEGIREAMNHEQYQVQLNYLAFLASGLEGPYRDEVVRQALAIVNSVSDSKERLSAFVRISEFVPETDWPDMPESEKKQMLAGIKPSRISPGLEKEQLNTLSGEPLLTAVQDACSINAGYGFRAELLRKLVPAILNLPTDERYSLLCQMINNLSSQRRRVDILADIEVLVPVIHSLAKGSAIAETSQAILDVVQWFPYANMNALKSYS